MIEDPEVALNRASDAHAKGDFVDAQKRCEVILDAHPQNAGALNLLGIIKCQIGKPQEGIVFIAKAAAFDADNPGYLNNLGTAFSSLDRDADALVTFKRVLELEPTHTTAHNNIATIYRAMGQLSAAAEHFDKAIALKPDYAEALSNYGNVLLDLGQLEKAEEVLEKTVAVKPDYEHGYNNLGVLRQRQGRYTEAQTILEQAIRVAPNFADPYTNLAEVLKEAGKTEQSLPYYQKSLELAPERSSVHSNYVYALNNLEDMSPDEITRAHVDWGRRHTPEPVPLCAKPVPRNERCRVGYVSPDFRQHSVSYFFEPLLGQHDRTKFEIFCYSSGHIEDHVTNRIRSSVEHWHRIYGLSDPAAFEQISADNLDILVDLSGHTMGNRLTLFGQKPAPVQVSYLGYPATTGLQAMDYRLTDFWADPPGETESFHTEELLRIDGGFLCYGPPGDAPDIGALPYEANQYVTFGSANNLAKVTRAVLDVWAEIMLKVPNSRLLLKGKALGDSGVRKRFEQAFADRGISSDRLDLRSWIAGTSHLDIYNQVDIALDPFPYNGTTTLCETSWMGVPTIVLAGNRHSGRVGVSLMTMMGHPELIARDKATYIAEAVHLAHTPEKLKTYRLNLRGDMQNSRLLDAARFTRSLEDVYLSISQ